MRVVYTLIAYRCSWTDSVMGCTQDRGDSDLEIETFLDAEAAAKTYAEYEMSPPYSQYVANSWEITTLFNGEEESEFQIDESNDYDELPDNIDIVKQFDQLCKSACEKIKEEREAAAKIERIAAASRASAKREQTRVAAIKAEKATLRELKDKYE